MKLIFDFRIFPVFFVAITSFMAVSPPADAAAYLSGRIPATIFQFHLSGGENKNVIAFFLKWIYDITTVKGGPSWIST
jgi:hypothetical protein